MHGTYHILIIEKFLTVIKKGKTKDHTFILVFILRM